MLDFVQLLADFYRRIFNMLNSAIITNDYNNMTTSVGSILFACLVIGFAASIFWKGAKA